MRSKEKEPPRSSENGQRPESEYDRFKSLTKRLVSVPKKEIEEQAKSKEHHGKSA